MLLRIAAGLAFLLSAAPLPGQSQSALPSSEGPPCELSDSLANGAPLRSGPGCGALAGSTVIVVPVSELSSSDGLAELLESRVPGLFSLDVGARNDIYRNIRLRGPAGLANCTTCGPKVFLDGVEINQVALGALDVRQIERVEVVRGPHAVLRHGPDAAAGVIRLFTRKTAVEEGSGMMAGIVAGTSKSPYLQESSSLTGIHGSFSSRYGATGYSFGVSHRSATGHVPELSSSGTTASFGFATRFQDVTISGFTRLSEKQFTTPGWAVAYYHLYQDGILPAWGDHIDDNDEGDYRNLSLGINLDYRPRDWWRTSLTVGHDQLEIDLHSLPTFAPRDSMVGLDTDRQSLPSLRLTSAMDAAPTSDLDASITLGLDARSRRRLAHQSYHRFSETPTVFHWRGQIIDSEYTSYGGFGEALFRFRDDLALSLGLRADTHSAFGDSYGTWALSPATSLSYERAIGRGWNLRPRVGWARGISTPTEEMLTGVGDIAGNPDISPQVMSGWEMGLGLSDSDGGRGAEVTGFYDSSTDLLGRIASIPGDDRLRYRNDMASLRNSGIELALWWLGEAGELRANFSTTRHELREATALGAVTRVREEPTPESLAGVEGRYMLPGWFRQNGGFIGGRVQHLGRRWAFDPRTYFTALREEQVIAQDHRWFESITRGDVFAGVSITRHADAALEILNITDDITPESPDIVLPGRQLRVSIQARL